MRALYYDCIMNSSSGGTLPLRHRLKDPVYQIFTDHLMIVLALLLIPTILLPFLFKFSQMMLVFFRAVNYVIIVMFVLEYVLKLYVADSMREYAANPWHILDFLIVVLSIANFLPWIPFGGIGRTSPLLRLLRITRIFAVAGRTAKRAIQIKPVERSGPPVSRMKINIHADGSSIKGALKEDISRHMAVSGYAWVDLQEVSEPDIDFISNALRIPDVVLTSKIIKESYPKIDSFKDFTSIFIRDIKLHPEGTGIKDFDISRNNMLIILTDNYIATISAGKSELFYQVSGDGSVKENSEEFISSILYAIFRRNITDYDEVVRHLEHRAIAMEELPAGMARQSFLEDTFYFKKEVQKIHGDLWHFTQVLKAIKSGKVHTGGLKEEFIPLFNILYDESTYLYETSENVRDDLISLIELHINTVSVGLNRVMRILAVIMSIGLIPSIINGLFGENLTDSPYSITISEIFFLEVSIMLLAAYAFYRHGWLR
jgi:Mg2+ and Co2+ transporter CorA